MVELLIAIIIIGILVTIIVPVLSNRAADARLAAAKADMESIANAESQVAIDTGYITRFHVLDDSGAVGDNLGSDDVNDAIDTIRDEQFNNPTLPGRFVFLDPKTGTVNQNLALYNRIENGDPKQVGWNGPYLSFQNKIKLTATPLTIPWTYGSPLDPWGNPYFLFVGGESVNSAAPAQGGWIDEMAPVSAQPSPTFNYGGVSFDATNFDRNTILSLGPNGLPGDGTVTAILGTGDDLVRAF